MAIKSYLKNGPERAFLLFLLLLSVVIICFGTYFLSNLTQPLVGYGDTNVWEYIGYYVGENIQFTPFPQLDLVNNQVFYPYGVSSVFQNWGFERDFFYAVLSNLFGYGGWLKIYYILSLIITSIGAYILLSREYSNFRAGAVSLIVTFANFNAINRYPGHYGYAILHWTVLSIIADFLIVKRVAEIRHVSLRLIFIRLCLLFLSLGQELGYITGFALTSFTVSFFYIVLIIFIRWRNSRKKFSASFKMHILGYKTEFIRQRYLFGSLIIFAAFFAYLYIPLIIEILQESRKFVDLAGGGMWSNPLRLFIPRLPDFNIRSIPPVLAKAFGGTAEFGDHNPGLFLVLAGLIGLWQSRHRLLPYVPLLFILITGLLYHPVHFPILRIYPWFTFYRIAGRITLIEPVILCMFALGIKMSSSRPLMQKAGFLLLVGLASVEIYTTYSWAVNFHKYSPSHMTAALDPNFFEYMNRVDKQPGEAVLDWPFCIIGGNGIGAREGLCPFYLKNNGVYALKRFHHKKVMGQYFGRLHPSQIARHLESGWNYLFSPDTPDIFKAARQTQCFDSEQWSFFTDFYTYNDFAGINLYIDLLPDDCVQEFYQRFGDPVAQTKIPFAGRIAFIAKSPDLRSKVDLEAGIKLKLHTERYVEEMGLKYAPKK